MLAERPDISLKMAITRDKFKQKLRNPESKLNDTATEQYEGILDKQADICMQIFSKPICVLSGAAGTGKTNIDDLKWLMSTVLSKVGSWKTSGWAYVADCTQMEPVGPGEIGQLVEMTKSFVEAGCKAFGFAEGSSLMLKVQTKKNTQMSDTGVIEGHFETVEQVLEWLKTDMGL